MESSCIARMGICSLNSSVLMYVSLVYVYGLASDIVRQVNVRTDSYGGSALARMKIVFEIIDAIRKELPLSSGFALGVKLNSSDYVVRISPPYFCQ